MIETKYTTAVSLLIFLPMILSGQRAQENVVPLKNWATPLYWHPSDGERKAATNPVPQLQFSANQVSTDALTFVAVTPCRLVDTRGAVVGFDGVDPFAGPVIPAGGTLTIPVQSSMEASTNTMPAPCGTIPSFAQAYSFNLTVIPAAAGGVNYVSIWPAGASQPVVSTLNDTQNEIVANAAIVPAGTPSGGVSVYNAGPAPANVIIDMNGFFAAPSDLSGNTALGTGTLANNMSGSYSTAVGVDTLYSNTSGIDNSGIGEAALYNNTIGSYNTATGASALYSNSSGGNNVAIGEAALYHNSTGGNNIALGTQAAFNVTGSDNIDIGNQGVSSDSGAVRIGTSAQQTSFFAAGIRGVTTGVNNAIPVVIDSNGQLGTVSSSRRFKEDIQDMGDASSGLLRLRPVTFRYRQPFADGLKPIEYGLIAEEVGDVYPDLVAHSADGQIETVKYQVLDSMLLNELQKQHTEVERLHHEGEEQNLHAQQQDETIRQLQARLAALEARHSRIQKSKISR